MRRKSQVLIFVLFGACSLSAQDKPLIDSLYRAFHAEREQQLIELAYNSVRKRVATATAVPTVEAKRLEPMTLGTLRCG